MRPYQQERSQQPQQPPRYKDNVADPVENLDDEAQILSDQDETDPLDLRPEEPDAEGGTDLEAPTEFVRGNVDVKEQMDRTTRRAEDAFNHAVSNGPLSRP